MDHMSDQTYLLDFLVRLLHTHSPSGYTENAAQLVAREAERFGYIPHRSNKGNVIVPVKGRSSEKHVSMCAHIDTLGLMVRSVAEDGLLRFVRVGGSLLPTLDGAYCTLYTRAGKAYTGTVLSLSPAAHVFDDAATRPRDEKNMAVRLDEALHSPEDAAALGIMTGDYLCLDPKTVVTDSGYIKSRFLDDKASAACLMALLRHMVQQEIYPQYDTDIIFTVHEEVGHGAAAFASYDELLCVDMGCVGEDLACTERQVSICAKDTSGPYDYEMTGRLIGLATQHQLPFAVDIYPHYSSDASVALSAGCDTRCALIGPGVHASHGMERTHIDALMATLRLIALYAALG